LSDEKHFARFDAIPAELSTQVTSMSPVNTTGPVATSWGSYIDRFHRHRPGITEQILSVGADQSGRTAYEWLVKAAPGGVCALDLACGSGPVEAFGPGTDWVGVDRSAEELAVAAGRGCQALVRADATNLPFRASAFGAVVSSMAVMIFEPADAALEEISRVLKPSGTAAILVPGSLPLRLRDLTRYATVLASLRLASPQYPNRLHRIGLRRALERVGLVVVDDSRRRFAYPLPDLGSARRFVESLYTPGRRPARIEAAVAVASGWVGSDIGIPLRRIVCRKSPASIGRPGTSFRLGFRLLGRAGRLWCRPLAAGDGPCCVDQADMGERLGEVTQQLPSSRIDFF
jgi:ubiquinone/menaquinone biosynthesis C-methylase UbiE